MARILPLAAALLLPFAAAFAADEAKPASAPAAVVAKPAASETSSAQELPPPLTERRAKLAAMMAVAFNSLPDSKYDKEAATLVWTLEGQFLVPGLRYDRYSALLQVGGRTYAGIDFDKQDGKTLSFQTFELETHEGTPSDAKIKIVEKDSANSVFFTFDYAEIEKEAKKAVQELAAKRK